MAIRPGTKGLFSGVLRRTWPLILVVILTFCLGVFLGAMGVNTLPPETMERLNNVVEQFLSGVTDLDAGSPSGVYGALSDNLVTWGVIFFLGFTIIGIPFILFLIFMRGFTLGFSISFLIGQKHLSGALLAVAAITPHNLILIPALFLAAVAALSFTITLLQRFFNTEIKILPNLLGYTGIMLTSGIAFCTAAIIEGYVTPWLTRVLSSLYAGSRSFPF